ncbi:MAG: tail fiber domain-containing protein [Patescibacteria group bacterium]
MRFVLRTIFLVFFSLIFISKPIVADASVATETIKNIGVFYANSTSSLIDKTDEKIYGVRDFYVPLFNDTAKNFKAIFEGAYKVSDATLNSVISIGHKTLEISDYQINNTGNKIGSVVASAGTALESLRGAVASKTAVLIGATNSKVNKMVKEVGSTVKLPEKKENIELVAKSSLKAENKNLASAASAINFTFPDPKELISNVYEVYSGLGNGILDASIHTVSRTGESWATGAYGVVKVISNLNDQIDDATVALGDAGYKGVKNVIDAGNVVGNGVLNGQAKMVQKTGDIVTSVALGAPRLFSKTNILKTDSASFVQNYVASVGAIWDFIIDKISDPFVPLFLSNTTENATPIHVSAPSNSATDGTDPSALNTKINTNSIIEKLVQVSSYVPIENSDAISKLRYEMISLNTNSVNYLKNLISLQAARTDEGVYKTIERSSGGNGGGTNILAGLTGILIGNNGNISATETLPLTSGGTGLSATPGYGQLLMGNSSGFYELVSTSTLGISAGAVDLSPYFTLAGWRATTTDALAEGSTNKYYSSTLFANDLTATTSLSNIQTLGGLNSFGSNTATTTANGNLSVAGNINFTGAFLQNGSPFVGSQWNTSGSDISYSAGNVGIGTASPGEIFTIGGTNPKPVIGKNAHTSLYSLYDSQNNTTLEINSNTTNGFAGLALSNTDTTSGNTLGSFSFASAGTSASEKRGAVIGSSLESSAASAVNANLSFYTNNAGSLGERMRIAANGNVGIGTTNPGAKLDVNGPTIITNPNNDGASPLVLNQTYPNGANFRMVGGEATAQAWSGSSPAASGFAAMGFGLAVPGNAAGVNPVFSTYTQADPTWRARLTIDSSNGNVGIGTTNPGAKLSVVASANYRNLGTSILQTGSALFAPGNFIEDYTGGSGTGGLSGFSYYQGQTSWFARNTTGNAASTDEVWRIDPNQNFILNPAGNSGKVGIGTTTPGSLLSIGGTNGISFNAGSSATSTFGGNVSVNGNLNFNGSFLQNGSPFVGSQWNTSGSDISYSAGNVGIGTASPTAKLEVNGTTKLGGLLSLSNGAAAVTIDSSNAPYDIKINAFNGVQFSLGEYYGTGAMLARNAKAVYGSLTDGIGFLSSGVENMTMLSSGNVGIGSTTPGSLLSLGTTGGINFNAGVTATSTFGGNLNVAGNINFNGSFLQNGSPFVGSQWNTSGSDISYSAGKVGIGTTTPTSKFTIVQSGTSAIDGLQIQDSGGRYARIYHQGGNGLMFDDTDRVTFNTDAYFSAALSTASLLVGTSISNAGANYGGNVAVTDGFYVQNNVGVGSTTPWGQLSVNPNGITGPSFVVGSSTATQFVVTNGGNVLVNSATDLSSSYRFQVNANNGFGAYVNGTIYATNTITSATNIGAPSFGCNCNGSLGIGFNGSLNSQSLGISLQALGGPITFLTNSAAEKMRLDVSGNLGIGTTTPWGQLSVNSNGISGPSFVIGSSTATSFIVDSGGNAGVGTTTPGAKFSVQGNGLFSGALTLGGALSAVSITTTGGGSLNTINGALYAPSELRVGPPASGGCSSAACIGTLSASSIGLILKGSSSQTGDLTRWINSSGATMSVVNAAGSFGVGTSSPLARLDVVGTNNGTTPLFQVSSLASFATTTRFFVDSGGNVAIGSASASAAKFQVTGTDSSTAWFVNTATHSSTAGAGIIGFSDSGGALSSGDRLGFFLLGGAMDGASTRNNSAGITSFATQSWSGSAAGANLQFLVQPNNTIGTGNRLAAMTVDQNGFVGVGSTTPWGLFSINPNGLTGGAPAFVVGSSTSVSLIVTSGGYVGIGTTTPAFPLDVYTTASSNQSYGYLSSSGTVGTASGANSYSIRAQGRIMAPEFNAVSDARLKNVNFELTSDVALNALIKLKPVSFNWKNEPTGQPILGFLAQDVESVIPNAVSQVVTGNFPDQRMLDYNQITAVMVGAVKEIKIELDALSEKVSRITAWFADGKFNVQSDVCVDDVCVSKEQFKQMLLNSGMSQTTVINDTPSDTPNNTSTTTEDTSTTTESTSTTTSPSEDVIPPTETPPDPAPVGTTPTPETATP